MIITYTGENYTESWRLVGKKDEDHLEFKLIRYIEHGVSHDPRAFAPWYMTMEEIRRNRWKIINFKDYYDAYRSEQ